ncbi:OmpA family protein [Mucilaginibacter ginkgonis]|uniref:OmpA family protein n=2 Tax=Mucilaginibacter ginkgonis TaxID=2682091 RepID=A0A6I4I251_9SPHI|nr:OmpA family protein [Mucilaginibacter ginkgonis]
MKINFNKTLLLVAATFTGGQLMAQTVTTTSMSSSQLDSMNRADYVQPFSPSSAYNTWSIGVNGGLLTPYTIFRGPGDDYGPQSQFGYGAYIKKQLMHSFGAKLSFFRGQVEGQGPVAGGITSIRQSYKTQIDYAADIAGEFTLANISYMNHHNFIQPYVSAGFGLMGFTPTLYSGAAQSGTATPYHADNSSVKAAYIPVGLGLKFNLSPAINLDLGYQVNFVDGDNFDGYSVGSRNDKFSYAHAGLEFSFGGKKNQLASHNPVNSIRIEYLTAEQQLQQQLEAERAKNAQLRNDLNSTNSNLSALAAQVSRLTADSDGDGVLDINDKCPNTPAGTKVDGSGCPLAPARTVVVVTDEDKRLVGEAIRNVEFDFGKSSIKPRSLPRLDRVADLLNAKGFSMKLAGHTDAVGSDKANLILSKARAESIKNYLVSKGVNASKIEATGYGESQPIASNKTAAGRAKNRRVEFTLY